MNWDNRQGKSIAVKVASALEEDALTTERLRIVLKNRRKDGETRFCAQEDEQSGLTRNTLGTSAKHFNLYKYKFLSPLHRAKEASKVNVHIIGKI